VGACACVELARQFCQNGAMAAPAHTLAKIKLFRSLSRETIKRLDRRCLWRDVTAREWLLEYEDEGTDVYFVVSGEVRVLIQALSGREMILADIVAGGYFGEMSAIDGARRSASIRALTKSTIARMPARVFWEVVHKRPDVADQLLKQLVQRIRLLNERVNEFNSLDVRHRIYAELLRLARPDRTDPNRGILSPPPHHAEIASRVSTRREMVARECKALERGGLLLRRRGALVITNLRSLVQRLEEARETE
jgi:CRP/FNR family transcriptional regulator, cyclic AMP receptor protein